MQFIETCKHCGRSLELNDVLQNKKFMKDGKSIQLTYYDCQHCGERIFVQIDDDTSLAMLDSIKKTFTRFIFRKRNGKKISGKENSKFAEARAALVRYRADLMREYTGKSVHDEENKAEYVLRFFV